MNSLFTLGLMIGISINDLTVGTTIANLGMTDVRFPKPVFHGDTIRVRTKVLSLRESKSRPDAGIVEFAHTAINQRGETVLKAGDCAGFKAGVANGHRIENRSDREAVLLEVGSRRPTEDACDYPDIDMVLHAGVDGYFHRDGSPYPKYPRRT